MRRDGRANSLGICLGITFAALVALAVVGYGRPEAAPAPAPVSEPAGQTFKEKWATLIKESRKVGKVRAQLSGPTGSGREGATLAKAFKDEFGIELLIEPVGPFEMGERLVKEREAGIYSLDVQAAGPSIQTTYIHPVKGTVDLREWLIHPEVLDKSAWWQGRFPWLLDIPGAVIGYAGESGGTELAYNTKMVDPKEASSSYWDVFDPKWKGKVVTRDFDRGGAATLAYLWVHPQLGKEFIKQLATKPTIVSDTRAAVDRVVRGTHPLCPFCPANAVLAAKKQGLPIEFVPGFYKEGSRLAISAYGLWGITPSPNPAGAKLFVNWFLTRKIQLLFQQLTGEDSFREDIPKDMVSPVVRRKQGVKYVLIETMPNSTAITDEARKYWVSLVKSR